MSGIELFVRHEAEIDALGYFEYIRHRNSEAAFRFLAAIDATVETLVRQPLMGRLRRFRGKDLANIRSWRVNDFETYLNLLSLRRHTIGNLAHQTWRDEISSGSAKELTLD